MIQEEKAVYYAKEFLDSERELEPHYYETQISHLADEGSHFDYNTQLLDLFWENKGTVLRRLNGRLFEWVLKEFFTVPKRSGLKVLDHWLGEFPEIQHWKPQIKQHYRELNQNAAYICSLYSPRTVPHTLDRMKQEPELHNLSCYLGQFWKELETHC